MLDVSKLNVEIRTKNKRVRPLTVLFIEWSSRGRDFEIDLPLMYFFEKILNFRVEYKSIFDHWGIMNCRPDIIIMSNTTGAKANMNMVKKIKQSGFLLFSHCSEGFFEEENIEQYLWGWNNDKELREEFSTLWNKKAYKLSTKYYPKIKNKLFITGSIGHDKYSIFKNKLKNNNLKYNICYAANDFNNLLSSKSERIKVYGEKKINKNIEYIPILKGILLELINVNPQINFLIKPHPADGGKVPLEVKGLKNQNIKVLDAKTSIFDALNQCDILITFRSSTAFESSLCEIPVISMCKNKEFIEESSFLKPILKEDNPDKIDKYIKEFYESGKIKAVEGKKHLLSSYVKKLIGFSDGLNHVRFMSFLKPYIESDIPKGKWQFGFKEKVKALIYYLYYKCQFILPNNDHINRWRDLFDPEDIIEQKKKRYPDFDEFYKENDEKIKYIYDNYASSWKVSHKINETSQSKNKE